MSDDDDDAMEHQKKKRKRRPKISAVQDGEGDDRFSPAAMTELPVEPASLVP